MRYSANQVKLPRLEPVPELLEAESAREDAVFIEKTASFAALKNLCEFGTALEAQAAVYSQYLSSDEGGAGGKK